MIFQEVEIFKEIPSYIMDEIAELLSQEIFSAGSQVVREGNFADFFYILEDGEIVIQSEGRPSLPVNKAGSVIGWSALVEPRRYTATAVCKRESKVIKIDGDRLMRVLEKHPAEGLRIMRRLAGVIASRLVQS